MVRDIKSKHAASDALGYWPVHSLDQKSTIPGSRFHEGNCELSLKAFQRASCGSDVLNPDQRFSGDLTRKALT